MKKFIIFFVIAAALIFSYNANAQEKSGEWKHFSVGASYFISTDMDLSWSDCSVDFQGLSIDGSYRVKLYRSLMLHPGLSFFYLKQTAAKDAQWIPGNVKRDKKLNGYGFNVSLPVGFYFPTSKLNFDVETGPVLNILFNDVYQKDIVGKNPIYIHDVFVVNRVSASWRFGVGASLKFGLGINFRYDLMMTEYMKYRDGTEHVGKPGIFSVGLNYNF